MVVLRSMAVLSAVTSTGLSRRSDFQVNVSGGGLH